MWIEPGIQDCVAYLFALDDSGEYAALGTAFLMNVPVASADKCFLTYAVTTDHSVTKSGPGTPLKIRFSKKSGGFHFYEVPHETWFQHGSTDVAVAPLPPPDAAVKATAIPFDWCFSVDDWGPGKFGIGSDVFFVGLFDNFPGTERNEPLVRFGHIALIPKEPIRLEIRPGVESSVSAYLVEAHSWPGLSGSPAFVHDQQSGGFLLDMWGDRKLLGLVQGHYNTRQQVTLHGDTDPSGKADVNAGISIIIPAAEIRSLLLREDVVANREARILKYERPSIPGSGEPPTEPAPAK